MVIALMLPGTIHTSHFVWQLMPPLRVSTTRAANFSTIDHSNMLERGLCRIFALYLPHLTEVRWQVFVCLRAWHPGTGVWNS